MDNTQIASDYLQAVKAIKQAILESRYRAARLVNKEVAIRPLLADELTKCHNLCDAVANIDLEPFFGTYHYYLCEKL